MPRKAHIHNSVIMLIVFTLKDIHALNLIGRAQGTKDMINGEPPVSHGENQNYNSNYQL